MNTLPLPQFEPLLIHRMGAAYGASDMDVERALHAAAESVRAQPGSDAYFDLLVLSRARLYLYKKALNGLWSHGTAH